MINTILGASALTLPYVA